MAADAARASAALRQWFNVAQKPMNGEFAGTKIQFGL
jgi:hypothetical protein